MYNDNNSESMFMYGPCIRENISTGHIERLVQGTCNSILVTWQGRQKVTDVFIVPLCNELLVSYEFISTIDREWLDW